MKKNPLGRTGLTVSAWCLGTMTWGNQTPSKEAHRQLDAALDAGIDLIDTAEMYPVNPVRRETVGRTERIIGLWLDQTGRRHDLKIATKQTGIGQTKVRDGGRITPATIREAVEGSLRRLKTDHIDIFQFHWPNRGSWHFRRNWDYDPSAQKPKRVLQDFAECLDALEREVKRGTIRHFGLSNETAWGTANWLRLADHGAGPRPVTIQNEYSLLCRHFDTDLAELSLNEDIGLMAYSPLAAGLLTSKYQGRQIPPGSRMSLVPDLGGRKTPQALEAVDDYCDVAFKHDLDMVGMALAFVAARPFVATTIVGATTFDQLEGILAQQDVTLNDEVRRDIERVHRAWPMPF